MLDRPLEHHPLALFAFALVVQALGAYLGHLLGKRRKTDDGSERADISAIVGATMTLLALIIGFTFAMAVNRYDQRKDLEDAEATAISAEYSRAGLLPADTAAQTRELLSRYVRQRILFYQVDDPARLAQIQAQTDGLERQLWSAVSGAAAAAPTPVSALAAAGMNDVLNAEMHTDAAWGYHIPVAVWLLLLLIAFGGNVLIGASEKRRSPLVLMIFPLVIAVPFFLIADVDSPRGGLVRVVPVNLIAHARLMQLNS
jgi:uncharacterized membrane protein